jgi:hypothetical protein
MCWLGLGADFAAVAWLALRRYAETFRNISLCSESTHYLSVKNRS